MKKYKYGWTIIEMVISLVVLSILVGVTVHMLKTRKVKTVPYVYAGILNLAKGHSYIMLEAKDFSLPEPAPTAAGTIPDPYCLALADGFNTVTPVVCNTVCGADLKCVPRLGDVAGGSIIENQMNFQTSNQVSYAGLNNPWVFDTAQNRLIKHIIMDINGGAEPTNGTPICPAFAQAEAQDKLANDIHIGRECFKLDVYKNGEIVPAGRCLNEQNDMVNCIDSNFPFKYDVWETRMPNDDELIDPPAPLPPNPSGKCYKDDNECRITLKIYSDLSYSEAYCRSEPSTEDNIRIISRAACLAKGITPNAHTVAGTTIDDRCTNTDNQFCVVRPTKPSMAGL